MGSITWDRELAEIYDSTYAAEFEPALLDPIVDTLLDLAQGGPALEFAVGTGRVALSLSARGISVAGVELSPHMAEQLRAKPGADAVPVTIGDMTTTRVPGRFTLVYLVANTIMNVTTQEDQLGVFANGAAHLDAGGCFVVEVIVPQLRRVPPGEIGRVFTLEPDHVGIETFDDPDEQIRVVTPLDRSGRPPGATLGAVPVRVAIRARPDGEDGRPSSARAMGRLGPHGLHVGEHESGRSVREVSVAHGNVPRDWVQLRTPVRAPRADEWAAARRAEAIARRALDVRLATRPGPARPARRCRPAATR